MMNAPHVAYHKREETEGIQPINKSSWIIILIIVRHLSNHVYQDSF